MSLFKSMLARTSLFHGMRQAQGTRVVADASAEADRVIASSARRRPDADLTALEREDVVLINKIRQSLYADARTVRNT